MKFLLRLILCVLPLLTGAGCYNMALGVSEPVLTPELVAAAAKLPPDQQIAFWKNVPRTEVSVATWDMLQQVERVWSVKADPVTGKVTGFDVSANHRGDVEMLKAVGQIAQQITATAIAVMAKGAAGGLPTPPDVPPSPGGDHNPPGGATIHVDGQPWLPTDLLRPPSGHMSTALAVSRDGFYEGRPKATDADIARHNAGSMPLGEFLAFCGDNWDQNAEFQKRNAAAPALTARRLRPALPR